MTQSSLTLTHTLRIPQPPNDLIELRLDYADKAIRGQLTGNGKVNYLVVPKSSVDAVSYFLSSDAETIASKFDQTGMVANQIDGLQLVEDLKAHLSKLTTLSEEEKSDLSGQIDRLAVVTNLMALHAVGFQLMVSLYGYNWVAEQSARLIRKSSTWLDLVERVAKAQEALKETLSS